MKAMTRDEIAEALEQVGGRRWTKGDRDRVYFNNLAARVGLDVGLYKSGNIAAATLNDERISNRRAYDILGALHNIRVWYDLDTGKLMSQGDKDAEGFAQRAIDSIRSDIARVIG